MKRKIAIVLSCMMTIGITVFLLGKLTDLMERKSSDYKYVDFFEQDENFDVLFMGTSHVLNGVFPMELWEDYGIVSYNLGGHSNQMATTYWTMKNAMDYTTPKVVVIDCMSCTENWKCSDLFSYVHLSLDAFPTTPTKIRAIWDLLDDENLERDIENGTARKSNEPRTRIGLLWDYSVYHSRWSKIERGDFRPGRNREKGAESRINVKPGNLNRIDTSLMPDTGSVGEEYLRKMIEDCQEQGIEVLLTYLPFPAGEKKQKESNYVSVIAQEYGVNYINFLDEDIIDYQTDLYDKNSHLNPSGARKVTDYLGRYLVENYDLENHKEAPEYSDWKNDYDRYCDLKNSNLKKQKSIIKCLMLLSGDDLDVVMNIRNKDIYKNAQIMMLLENLGVNIDEIGESTDFILICDGKSHVLNDFDFDETGEYVDGIHISLSDNSLYVDEKRIVDYSFDDNTGMQVTVSRDGSVVDDVRFVYTFDPDTTDINETEANR